MEKVKTPVTVTDGTWKGHVWRRARKSSPCDYNKGRGVWCTNQIETGDVYLEGEMNPYRARGFETERYCQFVRRYRCSGCAYLGRRPAAWGGLIDHLTHGNF